MPAVPTKMILEFGMRHASFTRLVRRADRPAVVRLVPPAKLTGLGRFNGLAKSLNRDRKGRSSGLKKTMGLQLTSRKTTGLLALRLAS